MELNDGKEFDLKPLRDLEKAIKAGATSVSADYRNSGDEVVTSPIPVDADELRHLVNSNSCSDDGLPWTCYMDVMTIENEDGSFETRVQGPRYHIEAVGLGRYIEKVIEEG